MPKVSTSFKPGNKAAEKWHEEDALKLGNELIAWLKAKPTNIYFQEFLYLENDYYTTVIDYLSNKFESFSNLIKEAKKIQELKIVKYSSLNKLNPTMSIFVLKNCHGFKDKQEIEHQGGFNLHFDAQDDGL